ncbi:MAG: helix-turn-helix transcriptional regulator [Woeseiaceae bacterium]|nr:helix-turn-helix transcriptional regulator [Woeseiaceae bacterium]
MSLGHEQLGQRLRTLRKRSGLTSKDLALAVGTTQSHLCAIENGRVEGPRLKLLKALASYFGMTVSEFLGETPRANASPEAELISHWYDNELSDEARTAVFKTIDAFRRGQQPNRNRKTA